MTWQVRVALGGHGRSGEVAWLWGVELDMVEMAYQGLQTHIHLLLSGLFLNDHRWVVVLVDGGNHCCSVVFAVGGW